VEFSRTNASSGAPRAIVVGYGPVGREVTRRITENGIEPFIIDMNVETVLALQAEHKHALYGDATKPEILIQAGIKSAAYLVITTPESTSGQLVLVNARALNQKIRILMRTRYLSQSASLQDAGADTVCTDEAEIATALAVLVRAHIRSDASASRHLTAT